MATATAEVAAVADDEELADYERLVGKRLFDEDDDIAAQITAIHTASSRGHKFEEIRATCVRLDANKEVPGCAITATGRVGHAPRLSALSLAVSPTSHVSRLTCALYFSVYVSVCPPSPLLLPIQVKTCCNVCGMDHEEDYGISSTDPGVTYQPIEELIEAYAQLE